MARVLLASHPQPNAPGALQPTAEHVEDTATSLCVTLSALRGCAMVRCCWETVMGNDLLRGFYGTQDVRIET